MRKHLVDVLVGVLILMLSFSMPSAAPNQPPTAQFTLAPAAGIVGTAFAVDASRSSDDKTSPSKLKVRWDWENDGVWDTALTTVKTATHQYPTEGVRTIALQVLDAQNLAGTMTTIVNVEPVLTRFPIAEPSPFGAPELDIAVDPQDPQRLVVASYTRSTDETPIVPYPAFYSTDGGASWGWSTGPYFPHPGDPAVEFDAAGHLFLTTIDQLLTDGNSKGVKVSRSDDGGRTFSVMPYAMDASTLFTSPDGSSGSVCDSSAFFDFPRLACDRGAASPFRNHLYVVALATSLDADNDGVCDSAPAVMVRSRDAGQTWDTGQVLPGIQQIPESIGIGGDGTLYIAAGGYGTPYCPSGLGIALRRSTDGGGGFLPPTCALASDPSFIPTGVNTAVDPDDPDKVFIAFSAASNAAGAASHIYLIRSTDAGATWSPPVRIDDVLAQDDADHIKPTLAVSTTGRLDIAWMDYRFSSPTLLVANNQPGDVYYAYSLDAGATWSPDMRLSAATAPLMFSPGNDYLTVVSSGSRAHAAYSMDLDGDGLHEAILTTLSFH